MAPFGRRSAPVSVKLNVYDLAPTNEYLFPIGLGFYHTGVEIGGSTEYTFADKAGVFSHTPQSAQPAKFRVQIDLGTIEGDDATAKVQSAIRALSEDKFGSNDYHILHNNCNHFSKHLIWKLLQKPIPAYINRMSDIAIFCSCLIPKKLLENAPVKDDENTETSAFVVKAPPGVHRSSTSNTVPTYAHTVAFSGTGSKLCESTSMSASNSTTNDTLTDRREKARLAALARLERQQQQIDSDKEL